MEEDLIQEIKPIDTEVKEVEIPVSDAEKEIFFKCFLSDEPYNETINILGGKLKITFRTLSIEENDDIFKQIDLDKEANRAKNDDSYMMMIMQYRLGLSLEQINGKEFLPDVTKEQYEYDPEDKQSYVYARAWELKKWPIPKLAGITEAFNKFEKKVKYLTDKVFEQDFWKADV